MKYPIFSITFISISLLLINFQSNDVFVKAATEQQADDDTVEEAAEARWLSDRDQFLDVQDVRSGTIDNITKVFLDITDRLVKAGRLMIETKRRMILFIHDVGEVSYDAKWALFGWFSVMFLFPILTAAVVASIIALFFQTELTNLQIFLHTRWDVGDKPDIITESKIKLRLGNLAMQRLCQRMSRHPEKFLPKQGKRDPEALIREKIELPQPLEPGAPTHGPGGGGGGAPPPPPSSVPPPSAPPPSAPPP